MADEAAQLFHDRLVELDPSLRAPFHGTDPAARRRALVDALGAVVARSDRLDELGPVLAGLGARHAGYGVQPAHYAAVADAFLWTLDEGLGLPLDDELRAAWTALLTMVAAGMRAGG